MKKLKELIHQFEEASRPTKWFFFNLTILIVFLAITHFYPYIHVEIARTLTPK